LNEPVSFGGLPPPILHPSPVQPFPHPIGGVGEGLGMFKKGVHSGGCRPPSPTLPQLNGGRVGDVQKRNDPFGVKKKEIF